METLKDPYKLAFGYNQTWARNYKTFSCSTQLSTKFNMLINFKMPTIVGILLFISMTNTIYERPSLFEGILVFMNS